MPGYPVTIEEDTNGTTLISFVDFPANTFGDEREEALRRAADLLLDVLTDYIDNRLAIPKPSKTARNGALIDLPVLADAKVSLYQAMRSAGVGKAELARRLDCHLPQIDRLLDLRHATRMAQLEAAFKALNRRIRITIAAA